MKEISSPELKVLDSTKPTVFGQALSPEHSQELTEMMVQVVERGTGSGGAIPGVRVAGKTGTAETGNSADTVWFASFAPADTPQVAVAVVLQGAGGSGGSLAAPIARSVMEAVLNR